MAQSERRKNTRFPAGDHIVAEVVGVRQPLTLVNIGPGGFCVATKEWLPSLQHGEVRFFTTDRQWSATFEIRMSFALLQPRKSGPYAGRYVTGFAFRDAKDKKVKARIQELIGYATHVAA
jgi:hypothetical protein